MEISDIKKVLKLREKVINEALHEGFDADILTLDMIADGIYEELSQKDCVLSPTDK